jgi:Cu/Ag efflux protein CusF
MKRTLLILGIALSSTAFAQTRGHDMGAMQGMQMGHPDNTLADGEVRKVDRDAKKLTIKHGPIKNLDMPAMTMVYQVKDPTMLGQLKPGDKVKFEVQKLGGALVVTRIETAK